MLWRWILLAVVLLLVLLCRTWVGVWAAYDGAALRLDARIGFLRVHILPAKKKPEKPRKEKKAKKQKKETSGEADGKKPAKMSFTLEDIKDALHTLLPPLGRALSRTRRGVRVKPLRLSVVLGGQNDPASTAQLYGELQAAVFGGMPRLEKLIDIRDPSIHTGVDFNAAAPAVEGEAGVTFRIGTLLAIGFGLAVPALRWFLRFRKRSRVRQKPKEPETPPETPPEEPKEPAA